MYLFGVSVYYIGFISILTFHFVSALGYKNKIKIPKNVNTLFSGSRHRRWYTIADEDDDFWRYSNVSVERQEEVMGRKDGYHTDLDEFWAMEGVKQHPGYNYDKHVYSDEVDANTRKKRSLSNRTGRGKSPNDIHLTKESEDYSRQLYETLILKVFYEEVASVFLNRKRVKTMFKGWKRLLKSFKKLSAELKRKINLYSRGKNTKTDNKLKTEIVELMNKSKMIFEDINNIINKVDDSLVDRFSTILHWLGLGAVWGMGGDEEDKLHDTGPDLSGVADQIELGKISINKNFHKNQIKIEKKPNKQYYSEPRTNPQQNTRVRRSNDHFLDWLWAPTDEKEATTKGPRWWNEGSRNSWVGQGSNSQHSNTNHIQLLLRLEKKQREFDERMKSERVQIPVLSYNEYTGDYDDATHGGDANNSNNKAEDFNLDDGGDGDGVLQSDNKIIKSFV